MFIYLAKRGYQSVLHESFHMGSAEIVPKQSTHLYKGEQIKNMEIQDSYEEMVFLEEV